MKTAIESPRNILVRVQKTLASRPAGKPQAALQELVDAVQSGRRYVSVAVYVAAGSEAVCQAFAGAKPLREALRLSDGETLSHETDVKFELMTPVRIANRVLALIVVRNFKALGYKERVFLKQVALAMRRFMVSSNGRLLQRKLRSKREMVEEVAADARLAPAPDHSSAVARRPTARVATVS